MSQKLQLQRVLQVSQRLCDYINFRVKKSNQEESPRKASTIRTWDCDDLQYQRGRLGDQMQIKKTEPENFNLFLYDLRLMEWYQEDTQGFSEQHITEMINKVLISHQVKKYMSRLLSGFFEKNAKQGSMGPLTSIRHSRGTILGRGFYLQGPIKHANNIKPGLF